MRRTSAVGLFLLSLILLIPAAGIASTTTSIQVVYPTTGTTDFGNLISGNCRDCPLPEDGSGGP